MRHVYSIKVTKLIVDFIKDLNGDYWLTDVRFFDFNEKEMIRSLGIRSLSKEDKTMKTLENFERAK